MNNTEINKSPEAAPKLGLATGSASVTEHPDHLGYAYARYEDDEDWHGPFNTREDAIAHLLSEDWDDRGWISACRPVTEHDDVGDDWTFICYGPHEEILPNTEVSNSGA